MNQSSKDIPIACVREYGVFTPEVKTRYQELWTALAKSAQGIEELENGYAIRFPLEDSLFLDLAELITYERLCCPFLNLALEMEQDVEEMSLRLTGSHGAKAFIRVELAALEDQNRS